MFDTFGSCHDGRNVLIGQDWPPERIALLVDFLNGPLYVWYERVERGISDAVWPDHVSTRIVDVESDAHAGLPGWVVVTHNTSSIE